MENGSSQQVVVVSAQEARYCIVAYTILVGWIFAAVAKLVTALVLAFFPLGRNGNLYVMLVAYYNADSPLTALGKISQFATKALFDSKHEERGWAINWSTIRWWSILSSIAGLLFAVDNLLKFQVNGGQLIVRNAARVNPGAIYYPLLPTPESPDYNIAYELVQPIRAAAAFQAAGRVAGAKDKVQERVKSSSIISMDDFGRPTLEFSYSYHINGSEMGLQLTPLLKYSVDGTCRTEYSWVSTTHRTDDYDYYPLWGSSDNRTWAKIPFDLQAQFPPWINTIPKPKEMVHGPGSEFAIVPSISHRNSRTLKTNDPWYLTEEIPTPSLDNSDLQHRVRRGRPPFYCWQNTTWSLANRKTANVSDLNSLPGMRLSTFLQDVFEREFSMPPFIQLANNLGYAALSSSMDTMVAAPRIAARQCSAQKDLERLAQISFVSSRDVVRNIVLQYSSLRNATELGNIAADKSGTVPYENADFILESKDIAALSFSTLVCIPVVCVVSWLVVGFLELLIGRMASNDDESQISRYISQYNLRAIGFSAPHLYRFLDEEICRERKWSGRTSTPYIKDIRGGGKSSGMRIWDWLAGRQPWHRGYKDLEDGDDSNSDTSRELHNPVSVRRWEGSQNTGDMCNAEENSRYSLTIQDGVEIKSSPFVVPKLMPNTTPEIFSTGSILRGMVSALRFWHTTKGDRWYELAMTNHWRPNVNGRKLVVFEDIEECS